MNARTHAVATLLFSALLMAPAGALQSAEAVVWSTKAAPVRSSDGQQLYRVEFTGRISPGYIVYGSDFESALGPNPTRVRFEPAAAVTPRDTLLSTGTKKGTDKTFNSAYTYFEGEAKLSQLVVVAPGATRLAGTIRGQTCHEADGTCQLFRASFDVPLP